MPVGRFVLDVHGESRATWPANDALCAALQINNHLQDCGKDFRELNRVYIPLDAFAAAGAAPDRSWRGARLARARPLHPRSRGAQRAPARRGRAVLRPDREHAARARGLGDPRLRAAHRRVAARARPAERARALEQGAVRAVWLVERVGHVAAPDRAGAVGKSQCSQPRCVSSRVAAVETQDSAAERASGSSFYTAMRIMPKAQREAMYEIYSFCRKVDDIADSPGPRDLRIEQLKLWRSDIDAIYSGSAVTRSRSLVKAVKEFSPEARGFPRRDRRHGNGRARGHPRAGLGDARCLLRPRRERGRAAVRARVRHGGKARHHPRPSSRPRAATDQHPARHRRGCGDRTALSAARGAAAGGHPQQRPGLRDGASEYRAGLRAGGRRARASISPRPSA